MSCAAFQEAVRHLECLRHSPTQALPLRASPRSLELRQKARRLYWLNPEPRGYWDTGDSVVSEYGVHCDGVYECRNLRQLERFVAAVIEA